MHVFFFLILTRLPQVNNSPRANVFPAGVDNFGKAMYRFLERSTQGTRDGFFLYSAPASFSWPRVDLAGLLRQAYSQPFWITSFGFVKVCGICFLSGKASLVSISAAILLLWSWHVYFLLEFEFRGKSCVEWEHGGEDGILCLLPGIS